MFRQGEIGDQIYLVYKGECELNKRVISKGRLVQKVVLKYVKGGISGCEAVDRVYGGTLEVSW